MIYINFSNNFDNIKREYIHLRRILLEAIPCIEINFDDSQSRIIENRICF